MLQFTDLSAGYGKLRVLHDINLEVGPSSNIAILGRNGAGKSTLMKAIVNRVTIQGGSVTWNDTTLNRLKTEKIVRQGVVLVPQSSGIFADMTVRDNLRVAFWALPLSKNEMEQRVDEIFTLLPGLARRRDADAAALSGGERQMLAIAKAVLRRPKLLLLDEPSTGLAPRVVDDVAEFLMGLRSSDLSIVVTEQNVDWVLDMVDTIYILDEGTINAQLDPGAPDTRDRVLGHYLGNESDSQSEEPISLAASPARPAAETEGGTW